MSSKFLKVVKITPAAVPIDHHCDVYMFLPYTRVNLSISRQELSHHLQSCKSCEAGH